MKYPPPEPGQKRHCALCGRLSGWEGKAAAFSDGYSPERGLLQRGAIGFAGSDGEAEVDDVAVGDGVDEEAGAGERRLRQHQLRGIVVCDQDGRGGMIHTG